MKSNSFSEQLLCSLESFRKDDLFCDTVIAIGEQQLKAHGVVLAAASSVFRAALESSAEPGLHFLNLSGYEFEVLEAAVRFIYTGKLEVEMRYASPEKLNELLTSLEDLGLSLDQYRSCEMVFRSDAEQFSTESLQVKLEEWNGDKPTESNALHVDQLSSSSGLREIIKESVRDDRFDTSSTSAEREQRLQDVISCTTQPCLDSLVVNEASNGWVLRSETGIHVVEIPAGTLSEGQPEFYRQDDYKNWEVSETVLVSTSNDVNREKSVSQVKKRRTRKIRGSGKSVDSQDISNDALSVGSGEPARTDGLSEVMHEELPEHIVKKKKQRLVCPTCGKIFGKVDHFTLHLRTHTGEKPYSCAICQKRFSFGNNLQRHMRSHTGDKPYLCHLCGSAFIQKTTLEDHIAVHTKEKKYPCKQCGKLFKSANCLRSHSRRHKLGSVRHRRENEPKLSTTSGGKHAETVLMDNGLFRFICRICGRDYASKNSLAIHIQHHLNAKQFACDVCKKSFWQRTHLEIHERTHTGERPFTCDTCGKTFTYSGGLATHIRLHTGEKPYKCNICNSSYTQQAHLKSHIRTHTGEKPYVCKACGKKYRNKVDLRYHLRRNDECNKVS